jgi:hypothetical protein
MNTTRVMSLVAATVFAIGIVGPAVAQTPAPAPAPATKSGDTQDMKDMKDKDTKKDGKTSAGKHTTKKKSAKKDDQTTTSPDQAKK